MTASQQVFASIFKGLSIEKDLAILDSLEEKGLGKFYLTGSRYFSYATEKSDYDFFVTWSPDLESHLRDNGFVELDYDKNEHYNDRGMLRLLTRGLVQVQLVNDGELKNKIQQSMSKTINFNNLTKEQHKQIWNFVYVFYESLNK